MNHTEPVPSPDPAAIIRKLGGPKIVAPQLELSQWTVFGWYRRGIPPERFPRLVEIAAAQGWVLSFEDLFAASDQHNGS